MREIKFRAWHQEHGEFVHADFKNLEFDKREFYPVFIVGFSSYPESDWVFSQYTGIRDKDGNEIYEGDIIQFPTFYETPEMTATEYSKGQVVFHEGSFTLDCWSTDLTIHDESLAITAYNYDGDVEIIGNIYENPELIEA